MRSKVRSEMWSEKREPKAVILSDLFLGIYPEKKTLPFEGRVVTHDQVDDLLTDRPQTAKTTSINVHIIPEQRKFVTVVAYCTTGCKLRLYRDSVQYNHHGTSSYPCGTNNKWQHLEVMCEVNDFTLGSLSRQTIKAELLDSRGEKKDEMMWELETRECNV